MMKWAGFLLSGLVVAFMIMDGVTKVLALEVAVKATADLGYPTSTTLVRGLGAIALVCTLLYAVPRTSVLGAILLTAYMGGAIASHLRVGSPIFTHILFGVYLAVAAWGGLFLRDQRVASMLYGP